MTDTIEGGAALKMQCVQKPRRGGRPPKRLADEAVDQLAGLLADEALAEAVKGLDPEQITGPGGLITQLAGRVIEAALGAELSEHLGYEHGHAPPGGAGNVRNGATAKTLKTDVGEVAIRTPRDRDASFEPQLVAKRQTRLAGLDDKILGMYAGGMTVRDIERQLSELYGVRIGRDTISSVTDAVLEDVRAWRTRPLDEIYAIVYLDCLTVKVREDRSVRNRACYLAIGVTLEGTREVLGLWWRESEGAKFWPAVLNDINQRGVRDVLICCVDGLEGFPEAIEAVFPEAWVQTCVIHQIRSGMRYVSYRDRKKVAAVLRPIYTAANADDAWLALERFDEQWGAKYPMIAASWRERWEHIIPFLSLPAGLRKAVYTTDERFKGRVASTASPGRVSVGRGRGRPRSEAQVLGLMPAAQLARQRALRVASRWRRPRPRVGGGPWLASRRRAGDRRVRRARPSASRERARP
jgi:putative transposase